MLGLQGPYAPSGAETVELAPESTGTLDLATGLAGEAGTVKLISDQPVTGAVISTSERASAQPDLAVQSAAGPLVRTGVSALATTRAGDSELVLSNSGTEDAPVSFEVLSYDGVVLRTDDVLLGPDSTATRRLTSPPPSYVVVRVPDGSSVVGGVVLTQPEGDIAGLATIPLTSPDVASRAPQTRLDPASPADRRESASVPGGHPRSRGLVLGAGPVRVDLVDAASGQRGELLDDGAVDQDPQAPPAGRAMLQRAPIDHHLGGPVRRTLERGGQRDLVGGQRRVETRHVLRSRR